MQEAINANPRPDYQPLNRDRLREETAPSEPRAPVDPPRAAPKKGQHPAMTLRDATFAALREGRINRPAALVAFAIAHHVDVSGEAWPSNERLGEMLALHPDNIARHKGRLRAAGLIADADAKQPRRRGGFWTANTVRVGPRSDENVSPSEPVGLTKTSDHNHRTRQSELDNGAARQLRLETWPLGKWFAVVFGKRP